MKLLIRQLILNLAYDDRDIVSAAALKLGCEAALLSDLRVIRRSIDARSRRFSPIFSLTVELDYHAAELPESAKNSDIDIIDSSQQTDLPQIPKINRSTSFSPIIVGAGPAGLMAALYLAESGLSPILIERGAMAKERSHQVARFWNHGELNPESNVLFGEGGAGLFSDGKLTARSKDRPRVRRFLQTLTECGAPQDILIDAEPHLGSDALHKIVPNLRKRIEQFGGQVRFHARLDNFIIENKILRGVVINGEEIRTDACILASGHSARDVYEMLERAGVLLESKAFAIGIRLDIPQHRIDKAQWGDYAGNPRLGAASFRLTRKKQDKFRACYTFCVCPGGSVIACASSHGELTTNGMSLSKRNTKFGNAAFLVPVNSDDWMNSRDTTVEEIMRGCAFQSGIEKAAYLAGGSDYSLPASLLNDFLSYKTPKELPKELSCKRSRPADLHNILPSYVSETLIEAVPKMLQAMKGVSLEEAVVYAAETRSSSPVRILRGNDGQSLGIRGLFPAGEGAGYAGGIVSSAVDGLCAAESLIRSLEI